MYILFEDFSHFDLLPFCYTRPIFAIRSGILTIQERWEKVLAEKLYTFAYDYLGEKYNYLPEKTGSIIAINGKFSPNEDFLRLIKEIPANTCFQNEAGEVLALSLSATQISSLSSFLTKKGEIEGLQSQTISLNPPAIRKMQDIFQRNAAFIKYDFELLTKGRQSGFITDRFSSVYGIDNIFVEEGVKVRAAIINAEDGPIYIGKDVEIQEGAMIHGTHAFCEHAVVNMGAKLRGDSTFGPYVKVGGEVGNSVIMGYSNKGHDGYMGNSVLGYWCNWGADTNSSNLKNTYEEVKLWNYPAQKFEKTGSQFCGLMMGDHAKCGINTMFNTGTVVGVSANIFGDGFPRNFLPDFSWGGAGGLQTYQISKAFQTAQAVMSRRNVPFDAVEQAILQKVFELTSGFRNWE